MNMPGLKYSRQRSAVLHYLRSVTSHPTAEHVYQAIREEFAEDTTACTKIGVCQIAPAYPYTIKPVYFTAFLLNRSIS